MPIFNSPTVGSSTIAFIVLFIFSFYSLSHFFVMLKNYLDLIRFDKPVGTFLLLWPCYFSFAFLNVADLKFYLIFLFGAFLMRSAGCIINDIFDRKIDRKVERTKNRPIASGKISVQKALVFLCILLFLALLLLLQLSFYTIIIGFVSVIFVILYPLAKRYFFLPQLFLGLVFNVGVLMAYNEACGILDLSAFLLYFACIFWTLSYDTIYAYQDKKDDAKIGVKSAALFFAEKGKIFVMIFYFLAIVFFISAVVFSSKNYFASILLTLILVFLLLDVRRSDLKSSDDCKKHFKSQAMIGGFIFFSLFF